MRPQAAIVNCSLCRAGPEFVPWSAARDVKGDRWIVIRQAGDPVQPSLTAVEHDSLTLGVARSDFLTLGGARSSHDFQQPNDDQLSLGFARSSGVDGEQFVESRADVSMSGEVDASSSCVGGMDIEDESPDLVDSDSEDELSDDEDDAEYDGKAVKFIRWRNDGFASVEVEGRLKRKIGCHRLSSVMDRRGPYANQERRAEVRKIKARMMEWEKIDDDEPNTRRPQLLPSPLEVTAMQVTASNRMSIQESVVVPPHSDEAGLAETLTLEDARRSEFGIVKPGCSDGTTKHMSTFLFHKRPKSISVVQSPEDWVEIEVTVDSGACETVMPASWARHIDIVQSATSHGAEYEVANGQTIPNLGERRCLLMTLGATEAKRIVFQVADVHKPLLSISRCADLGFYTCLGHDGGYMEDMVSGERIPLERKDNLYTMRAWIRRDPEPSRPPSTEQPFVRPV